MARRGRRAVLRDGLVAFTAAPVLTHLSISRHPPTDRSDPRIIGHRGCAGEFAENTISAVENAAAVVDAVEADLRRAATGEVVVIHDATVDRVTDGTGAVSDRSYAELRERSVLGTGDGVPRLEELFEAVPPTVDLVLDLKVSGLVDDVLTEATAHPHDVLLSSFDPSIVRTASDAGAETALICRESHLARRFRSIEAVVPIYPRQDVGGLVDSAVDLGCVAIHPRLELCLRTDLVARAHDRGLRVEAWTVEGTAAAERLRSAGVDGLITNVCTELV